MSCIWKIINIIDRHVGFLLRCVSPNPTVQSLLLIQLLGNLVTLHLPYLGYIFSEGKILERHQICICTIIFPGPSWVWRLGFFFPSISVLDLCRCPGRVQGGCAGIRCTPGVGRLFTVYIAYKIANGTSECWNLGNRSSALKVSRLHLN